MSRAISMQRSRRSERLDEAGARKFLAKIIRNLETPFVLVLDDFHSLNLAESAGSYFPALGRWIRLIDQSFNSEKVSFVVTLDVRIEQLRQAAREAGGAFSFSVGEFIALRPFAPAVLRQMLETRLSRHGWGGSFEDFISRDAFLALALSSHGHPRRALRVLGYAMREVKKAAGRSGSRRPIEIAEVVKAAAKAEEPVDETDLAILRYLADHGPTSASDEGLAGAIGLTRTSLRPRLEKLRESLQLRFQRIKVERTQQAVYALPE